MTTQVRTFRTPQPIGETLAATQSLPDRLPSVPRSIPDLPKVLRSGAAPKHSQWDREYKKFPMANHNDVNKNGGITYAYQDRLPKLPIPELSSTLKKYIAALRPLQTPREHAETKHAVDEFAKHNGPELQEKLEKYAQRKTSYIEQFCRLLF
jgi:carnitine O-acetyltransferase